MNRTAAVILSCFCIALGACNKAVSEQDRLYRDNMAAIQKFQTAYPALKPGFDEAVATVGGIWKSSESEPDPDRREVLQRVVNVAISNNQLFRQVTQYEKRCTELRATAAQLRQVTDPAFAGEISKTTAIIDTALADAEKTIREGKAGTMDDALNLISRAEGLVDAAYVRMNALRNQMMMTKGKMAPVAPRG